MRKPFALTLSLVIFMLISVGCGGGGGGGSSGGGGGVSAEAPVFSRDGGTYDDAVEVTISAPEPDALFRYTLDGTTPTMTTGFLSSSNSKTIVVSRTKTVKAIAIKSGANPSAVTSRSYTITGEGNALFPDPVLEAAVRRVFGYPKGPLPLSLVAHAIDIEFYDDTAYLTSVQGIDSMPQLTTLSLGFGKAADLSPLADLQYLQSLHIGLYHPQEVVIEPLGKLENLRSLSLNGIFIDDLSPLEGLTKLEALYLIKNDLEDLSPLSSLTNLDTLLIRDNRVRDVSPLAGMTNLKSLNLNYNLIEDISPLSGLSNLGSLSLEGNRISDFSTVSFVSNLTTGAQASLADTTSPVAYGPAEGTIRTDRNFAVTFSEHMNTATINSDTIILTGPEGPIEGAISYITWEGERVTFSPFEKLAFSSTYTLTVTTGAKDKAGNSLAAPGSWTFSTVSPSGHFPDSNFEGCIREETDLPTGTLTPELLASITSLACEGMGISSVSGIAELSNLTELRLNGNRLSELAPLAGLPGLQTLYLDDNQIADLSPLSGMTGLRTLSLSRNEISDLQPLAGLTNLGTLDLSSNGIADIGVLSNLTNLDSLTLQQNQISDISPLAGLAHIYWLGLGFNRISDISALSGLPLSGLFLAFNQIDDLTPLASRTELMFLNLAYNDISSLMPLAGLTGLNELSLQGNPLSSVLTLYHLTELRWLNLNNTGIDYVAPLAGLSKLLYLNVSFNHIEDLSPVAFVPNLFDAGQTPLP